MYARKVEGKWKVKFKGLKKADISFFNEFKNKGVLVTKEVRFEKYLGSVSIINEMQLKI